MPGLTLIMSLTLCGDLHYGRSWVVVSDRRGVGFMKPANFSLFTRFLLLVLFSIGIYFSSFSSLQANELCSLTSTGTGDKNWWCQTGCPAADPGKSYTDESCKCEKSATDCTSSGKCAEYDSQGHPTGKKANCTCTKIITTPKIMEPHGMEQFSLAQPPNKS